MARNSRCLEVLCVRLTDNELTEMIGVAVWGWIFSINFVWIGTDFWLLVNKVPSLDSMGDVITLRMMENYTKSGPLESGITVVGLVGYYG